ncbi:NUDIX hydrolase [Psychrobacillus glaciei]|uniref:NUDIX hydrolase n=1 Tax=Psychrobacillus glaciei TaxID=2283160 RepID=A0A5J6SN79_9BACI|nr:NUDIX hydrolase [Psychrobacillus glaciei]
MIDELEQNVLMVKNKCTGSSYYTPPGRAVEKGETLIEGAMCEVKEETGHPAIFFTFVGKIIGGKIEISLPEVIEEVTWIDLKQSEKNIHISSGFEGLLMDRNSVPYILREVEKKG